MFMLFLFDAQLSSASMMSWCMQLNFSGEGGEIVSWWRYLLSRKRGGERGEGKNEIGLWIKIDLILAHSDKTCCLLPLLCLACTLLPSDPSVCPPSFVTVICLFSKGWCHFPLSPLSFSQAQVGLLLFPPPKFNCKHCDINGALFN